jgi:hypothetical protein
MKAINLNYFKLLLLAPLLVLAGCASQENYMIAANSWKNSDISRFIETSHWGGHYKRVRKLPNGNRLYMYLDRDHLYLPGYMTPGTTVVDHSQPGVTTVTTNPAVWHSATTLHYSCRTTFIVNSHHKIIGVRAMGNNCVLTKNQIVAWSNPFSPVRLKQPRKKSA